MVEQDALIAEEEEESNEVDTRPEGDVEPEETELEALKAALQSKEERIAELEAQVMTLEQHVQEQQALSQQAEEQLAVIQEELAQAVERYRRVLLASAPEVPEGLVQGDTVAKIEEAFAQAREMVERIRDRIEAKLARERVPAGSPIRSGPDLSSLSPREKIAHALTRR